MLRVGGGARDGGENENTNLNAEYKLGIMCRRTDGLLRIQPPHFVMPHFHLFLTKIVSHFLFFYQNLHTANRRLHKNMDNSDFRCISMAF